MKKLFLLAAVAACAHPPPMARAPRVRLAPPAVELEPTHVMASSEMSPACRQAVYAAASYLTGLGAMLDVTWVVADHPSIALEPRVGQVTVTDGLPADPSQLAQRTDFAPRRAEIVLGYCSAWVATHELAHALGVAHRLPTDVLMHMER